MNDPTGSFTFQNVNDPVRILMCEVRVLMCDVSNAYSRSYTYLVLFETIIVNNILFMKGNPEKNDYDTLVCCLKICLCILCFKSCFFQTVLL